jgi:hypothetical protein
VYTPFGTHSAVSLLHSVLRPFSSDVQGSFAGPALLAVPLLLPVAALVRRPPLAVLATWVVALLVLALALAETLRLYFLAWKYVPLFASFRAPGRVTMMVPFLLLLLLAWTCRAERVPVRAFGRTVALAPLALIAGAAAALYAAYALVSTPALDALEVAPPERIAAIPPGAVRVAVAAILAWEHSLHGGRHLGTAFSWSTRAGPPVPAPARVEHEHDGDAATAADDPAA